MKAKSGFKMHDIIFYIYNKWLASHDEFIHILITPKNGNLFRRIRTHTKSINRRTTKSECDYNNGDGLSVRTDSVLFFGISVWPSI